MERNILHEVGDKIASVMESNEECQHLLEIYKHNGDCTSYEKSISCADCPISYECSLLITSKLSPEEINEKIKRLAYKQNSLIIKKSLMEGK